MRKVTLFYILRHLFTRLKRTQVILMTVFAFYLLQYVPSIEIHEENSLSRHMVLKKGGGSISDNYRWSAKPRKVAAS